MSAGEVEDFFSGCPKIRRALHTVVEVGLSYLSFGQPLSTLSGGERQRVKLAKYLGKKGNIYVLDEPTTGIHASDMKTIMKLLDGFVDQGNTVVVIEHNMDVVKLADYVIDMGLDGEHWEARWSLPEPEEAGGVWADYYGGLSMEMLI